MDNVGSFNFSKDAQYKTQKILLRHDNDALLFNIRYYLKNHRLLDLVLKLER
jgi:hypothetical protein